MSSEGLKMGEENDISETVKVEKDDDLHQGDQNDQPFVLLLRVIQPNGKPLPIGGFTERAMTQMLHDLAGVIPKEVVVLTDQEVVVELGGNAYNGSVKSSTWGIPLGWSINYC